MPSLAVELAFADALTAYELLGAGEALRIDPRPGDHHGYEDPGRYHDWYDRAFNHSSPLSAGTRCESRVLRGRRGRMEMPWEYNRVR